MSRAEVAPRSTGVKRPTLLVVDDEPEVLRSLHDLFRLEFKVLTHEHPSEALAMLASDVEVDVVMSDQRMPEMSGVQFLEKAAAVRPDATRLLFTGYADIKAVIDAVNRGHIARYVAKPWDVDELTTVIRQAVEQHALISEKKRLIRELKETNTRLTEAVRLKGKFIEVASHELNTPVTVVLGLTELWKMAMSPGATAAERTWVDRIHHAGNRLASTVERMLKLLKTGQMAPDLATAPVALAPLIRGAVASLQPFLDARQQVVEFAFDPDLGMAEVDPPKISDIIVNLVVNAIKFTPDGGSIRVAAAAMGPDHVRVRVSDPGVGITPADRTHLFEPFFTGNDTMHHSSGEYQFCKKGMGLGLCLVKAFVEMHGGSIAVDTAPGRGSTFTITLPRSREETPAGLPA